MKPELEIVWSKTGSLTLLRDAVQNNGKEPLSALSINCITEFSI